MLSMIQGSRESSWSHLLPAQTSARAGDASPVPETASLASVLEIDRLYSPAITFQSGSWRALPTAICWGKKKPGRSSVTCHKPMNSRNGPGNSPSPAPAAARLLNPCKPMRHPRSTAPVPPKKAAGARPDLGTPWEDQQQGLSMQKPPLKKTTPVIRLVAGVGRVKAGSCRGFGLQCRPGDGRRIAEIAFLGATKQKLSGHERG